jgi:hypothetical protein
MRAIITSLLASLSFSCLLAQSSVRDFEQYMNTIRTVPYEPLPSSILSDSKNELKLVNSAIGFVNDTSEVVRTKAYYIIARIGQRTSDQTVQRLAVDKFVATLRSNDRVVVANAIESLKGFDSRSFSTSAKDSIVSLVKPESRNLDELLRLVGYLEILKSIPTIAALISTADLKLRWAGSLALSRMGDQSATNFLLTRVSNAKMNDGIVYDIVPDLVYTRNPEVFRFLESIIMSDAEDCQSANPDYESKILCGYRVMELIAPVIKDFPVKSDVTGELVTSDYKNALKKTRTWLSANKNYTILRNTF